MDDVRGGNVSMSRHTLSQHDWYFKNSDVSCGNGFINSQTISQCNDSVYFNDMYGDVENGDTSGGHGSMNTHTLSQHNDLS